MRAQAQLHQSFCGSQCCRCTRPFTSVRHLTFKRSLRCRPCKIAATGEEERQAAPSLTNAKESIKEIGETIQNPEPETSDPPYKAIAGLAALGALLTAYLTVEKLRGGGVACPASGSCETILSSGYATVFGVPLSLFGFLAYSSVAGLSAWQGAKKQKERQNISRIATLGGGTILASTSASLLYLLWTQFPGQSCTWCLGSAFLSISIFVAACSAFKPRELAEISLPGGVTAASTILFLSLAWSGVEAPQASADINIPYQATIVRSASPPRAVDLARRLKEAGAKMYGAFWCSHCQEQKVEFGREAQEQLPYVECFPEGFRQGVGMAQECKDVKIEGFPLWIINGNRYDGTLSFDKLEKALEKGSKA